MKLYQDEIPFKDIIVTLENKEEANAFRELMDLFQFDMVTKGELSSEAYFLSVKLSNAFTECVLEVPLDRDEKDIVVGRYDQD